MVSSDSSEPMERTFNNEVIQLAGIRVPTIRLSFFNFKRTTWKIIEKNSWNFVYILAINCKTPIILTAFSQIQNVLFYEFQKALEFSRQNSNIWKLDSHYSKSQIFVQKFNFDKTPTFSRVFHPIFFDNFSREIKVVNS